MRLTYQTGIAALIQLAVATLLAIVSGLFTTVQQCRADSSDCFGDIITSLLFFMLITMWFAAVWILAAGAQTRRSRKLAFLLIGAEFMIFVASAFNASHHNNLLGLVVSLINATIAVWVGWLAFRLFIHGGSRVTTSQRSRRRRLQS